jgi:hypothetical protein
MSIHGASAPPPNPRTSPPPNSDAITSAGTAATAATQTATLGRVAASGPRRQHPGTVRAHVQTGVFRVGVRAGGGVGCAAAGAGAPKCTGRPGGAGRHRHTAAPASRCRRGRLRPNSSTQPSHLAGGIRVPRPLLNGRLASTASQRPGPVQRDIYDGACGAKRVAARPAPTGPGGPVATPAGNDPGRRAPGCLRGSEPGAAPAAGSPDLTMRRSTA